VNLHGKFCAIMDGESTYWLIQGAIVSEFGTVGVCIGSLQAIGAVLSWKVTWGDTMGTRH